MGERESRGVDVASALERLADPRLSAPFLLSLTLATDHTADHDAAEASGARAIEASPASSDRVTEERALVMLSFSHAPGRT